MHSSIAKDEVALLAERLEFFIPQLMKMMAPWQWLLYLTLLALLVTIIDRHDLYTWTQFLIKFLSRAVQYILTVFPVLYLIDYLHPILKHSNPIRVSAYILVLLMSASVIAISLVMLLMINIGELECDHKTFILYVVFNMVITGSFTLVLLLHFSRRHRELMALKQSFEHKLTAQDDIMKARLAPHFFFNTINSLLSLIESDPPQAAKLLQHISVLFRASFNGAREISFEEELALCEHYLAIESPRLANKLIVTWQLPDDDVLYDMVITALTLQSILEQLLLNVAEMTTQEVTINIAVTWQQHRVKIIITVQLPSKVLIIAYNLRQRVNFYSQMQRLRIYFGQDADIQTTVTSKQLVTIIDYPLQDVGL
jgi:two-component system sensor histidine kinase AlgZ